MTENLLMIVDDSRTMRDLLRQSLLDSGQRVTEASTGEEAIQMIEQGIIPDAIILDVEMPGMGGFETCQAIRNMPSGEHIPIVIATGLDDLKSITRAYECGATDFVTKPINWNIIGNRMQYIIRNSRQFFELMNKKADLIKSQNSITQLNEELEQRVIERTQQLQETNNALNTTLKRLEDTQDQLVESEKMASLGNLVSGIAHDVNTPIGVSVTAITHLDEKFTDLSSAIDQKRLKQSELLDFVQLGSESISIIKINLKRAIELIRSFKLVSVDQASESLNEFNAKDYFNEILFSLKPLLTKNLMTVQLECPEGLILNSYPGVLFQVMTILTMNTINHAYNTGEPGLIFIDISVKEDNVILRYSDKGKGISEENMSKIYDPFFTTKRSDGCSGLGLHIAYNQITKILGGTIKCESVLGEGAQFTLTFPIKATPASLGGHHG